MKELIYPAVLYKDEDNGGYTIAIHDLSLITEGKTVEEAFINARDCLTAMFECAIKFNCEIDAPSPFSKIWKENKGNIVILVDALAA